ncbi:MAG: sulfide/dihydroorotate dehydrogenase-like FAD/NAD-binding protein [Bacillota bacterium]|nr:sulfide/dihydroorotate dehydrogenase-like FAD/NAD-binding protein [Bacillota bacterium]
MYKIVKRVALNPTVTRIEVDAPYVAKAGKPGQFIILRANEEGERIPFTIAGCDPEKGTVSVIYQVVGASTEELNHLKEGDYLADFAGPLGKPSELEGLKKVCVVGGGAGCAIALPLAEALHKQGSDVTSIAGFRSQDLVILEDEFTACSNKFIKMSDDGTWGRQGLVTAALEEEINNGANFDEVIAIGPLVMMKFVVAVCKKYGVKCVVSMNPIMIDGTGMCGCCRILVGGKMKFACVDGPDFDGYEVDFDSAMVRNMMYRPWEIHKHEEVCNLFKKQEAK